MKQIYTLIGQILEPVEIVETTIASCQVVVINSTHLVFFWGPLWDEIVTLWSKTMFQVVVSQQLITPPPMNEFKSHCLGAPLGPK